MTPRPARNTVTAAKKWLGKDESDPAVIDLVNEYVKAWQWATPPSPGELPDWCAIIVMEWVREGGGFDRWPVATYRAPSPDFPWYFWVGDVGDLIAIGSASPRVTEVTVPEAGDVYTQGTTHAGVVASVDGSSFTTVDGNWSHAVGSRTTGQAGKRFWRYA